jgi:hypothetical protein
MKSRPADSQEPPDSSHEELLVNRKDYDDQIAKIRAAGHAAIYSIEATRSKD